MAAFLEHPVELIAHVFPNGKAVGPDDHAAPHGRVVGQLGLFHDIEVPLGIIFPSTGYFLGHEQIGYS
jgi:hypothetical protein